MPHPFTKGTAFSQFTNTRPQHLPDPSDPTGTLRRSLCKLSILNLPDVSAPVLSVSFVPQIESEALVINETWEDLP